MFAGHVNMKKVYVKRMFVQRIISLECYPFMVTIIKHICERNIYIM